MLLEIVKFASQMGMNYFYKGDRCPEPLLIKENLSYVEDELECHKLDVIYPAKKKARYPFIVNIHGGAFAMHSKDKLYRNYGMRLAGNEFAVVNINYGLAPEYTYPTQVVDVLRAIEYIAKNAEQLSLDTHNLFLAGDSAGAYLAAMAACVISNVTLRERYQFKADVKCRALAANSGMYDFTTLMNPDVSFPMKREMIELLFGCKEFEHSPEYPYSSVLKYVNEYFPPTYLMDTKKKSFEQEALRFEEVLKNHRIRYKIHIFEKGDKLQHAFNIIDKYPQSKLVLAEIFQFFNSNLEEISICSTHASLE